LRPWKEVPFPINIYIVTGELITKRLTKMSKVAQKAKKQVFQVILKGIVYELQPEPGGGYTITIPSLPGCISYGSTFEEAMDMIQDAMKSWLEVAKEEGIPVPEHLT
jgi:antitoxin HicB